MLLDAHVHLLDLHDEKARGAVLEQSLLANPVTFFCNTTSPEQWDAVTALAPLYPSLVPFCGLHPWYTAARAPDWQERLERCAATGACRGIGEVGLDTLQGAPLSLQQELLSCQIEIARAAGKPLVLHCVHAWGELLGVLGRFRALPPFMVHAFGSSIEVLEKL